MTRPGRGVVAGPCGRPLLPSLPSQARTLLPQHRRDELSTTCLPTMGGSPPPSLPPECQEENRPLTARQQRDRVARAALVRSQRCAGGRPATSAGTPAP